MHEMSKLEELRLRSQVMEATVELLNAFGEYMHAEDNSPVEDQLESAMDDRVDGLMKTELGGHVLLCLTAMIHHAAEPEAIQAFLNEQSEEMFRQAAEINAGD